MKLIIEPTEGIVYLDGTPSRIWKAETEQGEKLEVLISFVKVDARQACAEELSKSLKELVVSVDRSHEFFCRPAPLPPGKSEAVN